MNTFGTHEKLSCCGVQGKLNWMPGKVQLQQADNFSKNVTF